MFKGVAAAFAAGQAGGEHYRVAGQRRGGYPVVGGGGAGGGQHDRAGDAVVCGDPQCVPAVVVKPGKDLSTRVIGERGSG